MTIVYCCLFFVIGSILGSFYYVIALRLPKGESIFTPPYCDTCHHLLQFLELIPIASYLDRQGRCKYCGSKIPLLSFMCEALTGILFVISFLKFGITMKLLVSLTFISALIIIIVSDYKYMIINDSILLVFSLMLITWYVFIGGYKLAFNNVFNGLLAFLIMFGIKLLGDFVFKKESMGGGDVKLMFVLGLVNGYKMATISIFFAAMIGLPISIFTIRKNGSSTIPFGPPLAVASLIIFLFGISITDIMNVLY